MSPEGKTPKPRRKAARIGDNSSNEGYLDGQMLIAMPVMGNPRFERSVIYIRAFDDGAMGIIVNRRAGRSIFRHWRYSPTSQDSGSAKLPDNRDLPVQGRPGRTGRGSCCIPSIISQGHHPPIDDGSPDRDRRHSERDRQRRGTEARDPGAGLCRLGARPA